LSVQLIQVPYNSGVKNVRMGNGPAHIVKEVLHEGIAAGILVDKVEIDDPFPLEVGTTFRVVKQLSISVRDAIHHGCFPLVLAGGCLSSVGTLAGLDSDETAIVWLDAHGDFNTPEITVSGYLDGMALATSTGRCWRNMTAEVPGFRPIPERNVLLVGARDFDPEERALLDSSPVRVVGPAEIRERSVCSVLETAVARLQGRNIYLHIDLDVLDPQEARVNHFPPSPGLMVDEVLEIVNLLGNRLTIAAAAITAYDPDCDHDGKGLRAATAVIQQLCSVRSHAGSARPN
jgi:arginase